jgi:hypothetical protein
MQGIAGRVRIWEPDGAGSQHARLHCAGGRIMIRRKETFGGETNLRGADRNERKMARSRI